jgi:hypothetical protein
MSSSSEKAQPLASVPKTQAPNSKQSDSQDSQSSQSSQSKKLSLNPIINSFTRKIIAQREESEKPEKTTLEDERLRESLDKLKTGKFIEGASTASGELSIDTQECMPLKWYKENSKTLWVVLVADDLNTPSKDIAPRQGIFAKAIKDAIHEAMHKNLKIFGKWFSSKGQILSPVSIDVNNSNPNDITAIFCPPTDVQFPDLIEPVKSLEPVVPIPYKPGSKPKKPGLFFISFTEFNPLDDVTILALSFHVTFTAEIVRKNFSKAADIVTKFFKSKGIDISTPDFTVSLPHPTNDDDKATKSRTLPSKLLITFNASDLSCLEKMALEIGRMHGTTIDIPESIADIANFSIRVHCKIFEHRIDTERPLWTRGIIETLHSEAQTKAAQNVDAVLKLLFCHHHFSEKGENLQAIRAKLNLSDNDNMALSDDALTQKLQTLIAEKIIQISPSDPTSFMVVPTRRKWRSLKIVLQNKSSFKLQQKDLGIHLTTPFGLPPGQPIISMACFYLTTSSAVLASYSNTASFTTHDLWKYMSNRFKQYQTFYDSTPQIALEGYSRAYERTSAIEKEYMTPAFFVNYASECAYSASPNSFVNPLSAACLAFPSEFKQFEWIFLQMKDDVGKQSDDDITSNLELIYHIKSANKDAKMIFIKYVGSFSNGESMGHFISLNVHSSRAADFLTTIVSSTSKSNYIAVHSEWPSKLLKPFPIKEAQPLIYESPVSEIIVLDSSQSQRAEETLEPNPQKGTCAESQAEHQSAYDEEQALTSVLQHFELIGTRLNIAASRLSGYSTLDCSTLGRDVLSRRIDELNIISMEINSHIQQAVDLKSQFPADAHDNPDDLNPHKALEKMDETAQQKTQEVETLISKFKTRISELPVSPVEKASQPKTQFVPISEQILRIRSSFVVDSVSADIETEPLTKRLRFLDTFWILPTRNSKLSFYHSVLIASSQDNIKQLMLRGEKSPFSYLLTKEITHDVASLFEQTTKAMFRGFADCAICSTSNTTFNDYLERKNVSKNVWEAMPEDHFLCTPSLVAQAWQLNILIVWKRRGITRVFALPHGLIDSPIIPILFSADKSLLDSHGNPSIVASPTANRFYPLAVSEDKTDSWESTFTAESTEPESAQSTKSPIITASFVKKIDKEFAFQSLVLVDGPGKDGKEVSSDTASERTMDGLSEESQLLMQAFLNDQSDDDDSGPPTYNPILDQVDKEMAMRKLREANLNMFKQIRRRRIIEDDDEDLVPMIRIEHPNAPPHTTPPTGTSSISPLNATSTNRAPPARGGSSTAQERPKRAPTLKTLDGKNAAATTGSASRSSSK